ncbi:MAG: PAS domain S-box protein [Gaiellaceae bacterium]|jgi:PAS domain S-box-containing protein
MPSLLTPTEVDAVQETLLGEALEHAPIGAIVLDETGRYLAANRAACRLTGCTREELLELGPSDFAAEPEKVPAKLEEMASGRLMHGSTQMRRRDGSLIPVEYRVGATRSGGLPYFVLVFWEKDLDEE